MNMWVGQVWEYLSRDRGRREEEREADNENQGEVMLAWGETDRDQK